MPRFLPIIAEGSPERSNTPSLFSILIPAFDPVCVMTAEIVGTGGQREIDEAFGSLL
jgi:hypothetical protein